MSAIMNPARPPHAMKPLKCLAGYQNGRLNDSVLVKSSSRGLKLNLVSVRRFNAIVTVAINQGIALTSTGDYRTYAQQVQLQDERYDEGYFPGRDDYNTYNGIVYSLKPGKAGSSTPGFSNHGTARSRDWAVFVNGKLISLRQTDKLWLAKTCPLAEVYFEVPSEDWHGSDYGGDVLNKWVLDVEAGKDFPPIPHFDPTIGQWSLYPLDPNKAQLRLLNPQMHSELIAYLQGVIKLRAHLTIDVDGWFGPQTDAAVRKFQKDQNIKVDGLVGPVTWSRIDKVAVG